MGMTSSNNSRILKIITEIYTWIQKKRNEFAYTKHHVKNQQKKNDKSQDMVVSIRANFKRVHELPWFRKKLEILDVKRAHY